MKKLISMTSLMIALAMLFSLAGCVKNPETPEATSAQTTQAPPASSAEETTEPATTATVHDDPGFAPKTYNGQDFRILADSQYHLALGTEDEDGYVRDVVYLEELGTTSINEALRDRNNYIEDTYDVHIKAIWDNEPASLAMRVCRGRLDVCDILEDSFSQYATMLANSQLLDMNDFDRYLDLTHASWDQNCRSAMSIAHDLFFCCGDILLTDKMGCWGILFNRDMMDTYSLGNMYDIVDEGNWTYDTMLTMEKAVSNYNSHEPNDWFGITWGAVTEPSNTFLLWHGCGYQMIEKDPVTDYPFMTQLSETAFDAMKKVCQIQFDPTITLMSSLIQNVPSQFSDGIIRIFMDGHSLFFIGTLSIVESMRQSDTDFGVLPMPKVHQEQQEYHTSQSNTKVYAVSIPDDEVLDRDFIGMILQAMSVESTNTLKKGYYEQTLVYKGLRKEEDERMLDMIFSHRVFDLTLCTSWGSGLISDIASAKTDKKVANLKSNFDRYKSSTDKSIEDFMTQHGYIQ